MIKNDKNLERIADSLERLEVILKGTYKILDVRLK